MLTIPHTQMVPMYLHPSSLSLSVSLHWYLIDVQKNIDIAEASLRHHVTLSPHSFFFLFGL